MRKTMREFSSAILSNISPPTPSPRMTRSVLTLLLPPPEGRRRVGVVFCEEDEEKEDQASSCPPAGNFDLRQTLVSESPPEEEKGRKRDKDTQVESAASEGIVTN